MEKYRHLLIYLPHFIASLWRLKYFSIKLSVLLKQSLNIIVIKHSFIKVLLFFIIMIKKFY